MARLAQGGVTASAGRCDVLVVDDDPDIREALQDALALSGYDVLALGDAREALAWLERGGRPATIILDLMMPGMSGWELRAELDARPQLALLPVIVLSGARDGADVRADAHLKKPVELQALLDAVARSVGRRPDARGRPA